MQIELFTTSTVICFVYDVHFPSRVLRLHGIQTAAAAYNPVAAAVADYDSLAAAAGNSRVKRFGAGKVFYKIGMYKQYNGR